MSKPTIDEQIALLKRIFDEIDGEHTVVRRYGDYVSREWKPLHFADERALGAIADELQKLYMTRSVMRATEMARR